MTRMADTADPMNLFINRQEYNLDNFTNEISAQFPQPLAASEPRYPALPQNPTALYGPKPSEPLTVEELDRHMANFELASRPPISQKEAQASTVVIPTISVLPSTQTSTTIQVTQPQAGNTNSGYTTRSVTGHSKPKEPPHGFIETIKKKTGCNKENSKRSKSDEPK